MTETTKKNIEDAVLSKLGELLKSGAEEFYLNVKKDYEGVITMEYRADHIVLDDNSVARREEDDDI